MDNTASEIKLILDKDVTELFSDIGLDAPITGFGLADESDEEKGRSWYEQNKERLREKVCGSYIAELATDKNEGWDKVLILAGLADIITGVCAGVSPLSVSALIMKLGLKSLCHSD